MKLILLFLPLYLYANELEWVDTQVKAIKPARTGVSVSEINALSSPFLLVKKEVEKKQTPSKRSKLPSVKYTNTLKVNKTSIVEDTPNFSLAAIMNKSALINGKWYKLGESVGMYTLSHIEKRKVTLSNKTRNVFLSTETKNKKIKFKNN